MSNQTQYQKHLLMHESEARTDVNNMAFKSATDTTQGTDSNQWRGEGQRYLTAWLPLHMMMMMMWWDVWCGDDVWCADDVYAGHCDVYASPIVFVHEKGTEWTLIVPWHHVGSKVAVVLNLFIFRITTRDIMQLCWTSSEICRPARNSRSSLIIMTHQWRRSV